MSSLLVHHLVISGRGQNRAHLAGCDGLLASLDEFRRPGVRVEGLTWNADWKAEAAFIARHAAGERPLVCLYPYSWGFGWGAIQLARELQRHEIGVYGMRVCDGVYRHWYRGGNWRAYWRGSVVQLPANVQRENVEIFVQENTRLRGHRVVDARGKTIWPNLVKRVFVRCSMGNVLSVPAAHGNMDESAAWLQSSIELAGQVDAMLNMLQLFGGY